jgi:CHAP domain
MTLEATLARVSTIRQALADPAAVLGTSVGAGGGTAAPSEASGAPAAGQSSFASMLQRAAAGNEEPAGTAGTLGAPAGLESASLQTPAALGSASVGGIGSLGAGSSSISPYSLEGVAGTAALTPSAAAGVDTPGQRIVAIAESQIGQTEQPPGSNESPAIAEYRGATEGAIPGAPWCAYFASWVAREAGEPLGSQGQGLGAVSDIWSWAQSTGRAIPNGPGVVPKPGDLIVFGDEHVGIVRDVLPSGQIQTIEGNYENKVAANVRSPTEATGYVEMS